MKEDRRRGFTREKKENNMVGKKIKINLKNKIECLSENKTIRLYLHKFTPKKLDT